MRDCSPANKIVVVRSKFLEHAQGEKQRLRVILFVCYINIYFVVVVDVVVVCILKYYKHANDDNVCVEDLLDLLTLLLIMYKHSSFLKI